MTIENILAGESKNVEFKENLPDNSKKYMKSVVAFANGTGGKIIFGIADKTREVIGIDRDDVFKTMDSIANAVSDSCEPAIIPDITLQTIDEKTVIVVEVSAGRQRPYYMKSLGIDNGVYVRVAGTTRLADEYMIKELILEGSNRYFDQTICTGLEITDKDIDMLCNAMKAQAIKNAHSKEERKAVKDVGRQQLCSWGVLIEKDGKYHPSNAYAILTGCGALHVAIQCGVFKGTTKETFVDRRNYTGPIWEQIDEAYQFVLRNIHMGASFNGIYRQDVYEIPPDAIRELIINAAVHRSYLDHGNIQVAIYDNRLEITSPGKLPMGQTLERMREGYSQIRNEALAYVFSYMNLIEHWGSGIPRMIGKVRDAGLQEPEFIGGEVDLRINIYRGQINETNSFKHSVSDAKTADKLPGNCRETAGKLPTNCRQTADKLPGNCRETAGKPPANRRETADKLPTNCRETADKLPGNCRETAGKPPANRREIAGKLPMSEQEQQVHKFVMENGSITTTQVTELLDVKQRRAREILGKMVEKNWLRKEGTSRSTVYVINKDVEG